MRLGRTRAVALEGIAGTLVDIEVHISPGLPHVIVTGLPDKACGQAPDRVRSALLASGHAVPSSRVTVNLSPASIPKRGTGFDLGIAVAVLAADGRVPGRICAPVVHIAELSLDGSLRPVRGVLPAVLAAVGAGAREVVVAPESAAEALLVEGVQVHAPPNLATLIGWYLKAAEGVPMPPADPVPAPAGAPRRRIDLADVVGQDEARLALEIAAAGAHHLHLTGPPGSGKTMLAERLVTILPRLTREQALQTQSIRSLTGELAPGADLDLVPPFVAPHHSASTAAVVGGGSASILPGAISRAHLGVLFLDEAAEFASAVLQTLRQPLESGDVVIARANRVIRYPARFQLVLASNPCPCGRNWGRGEDCVCRPREIRAYAGRLSGPLRDRIDLSVGVPPVSAVLPGEAVGEDSVTVAARVAAARDVAAARWQASGYAVNGDVPGALLRRAPYRLDPGVRRNLDLALDRGRLSLRGYDRVLRIAWSLADLGGRASPGRGEVDTAIAFRDEGRAAA